MTTANTKRFFCFVAEKVEGPFDVVELAGLWRAGHVTSETPVCVEGSEQWLCLQDHPEHVYIGEISPERIAAHLKEKTVATESAWSPRRMATFLWIMLPVFGFVLYLFVRKYLFYHLANGW